MLIAFCLLWLSSSYIAPIFEQLMVLEIVAFYGEKYVADEAIEFGILHIMGIIPFYSEVAIVPKIGTANGVVVSDGASERTYNQRYSIFCLAILYLEYKGVILE